MKDDNLEFDEQQEEEQPTEVLPKERRVYTDKPDRSIFELYRQYQKGNLELRPGFQRLNVWDNAKSSRLIESVLLEVPIPVIYLSEESDSTYAVIDGQQRLNAFMNFLENKLRLSGLTILSELNGQKFQDVPQSLQDKFENATIRIIEVRKESHPDVKFEIFERLNTGAVQLNAQELRNCVYRGKYNDLLQDLTEDKDIQFLLGLNEPHYRMQDRELILRFFGFYHNTYLKYTPSMKHFLNKEMEQYRNLKDAEDKELRKAFKKSVRLSKTVFGNQAFRRFEIGSTKDPNGYWEIHRINKGLFDVVMFGFSLYEENQVIPNSDSIREELLWLMSHDIDFREAVTIGTNDRSRIFTRFDKWLSVLKEIMGVPLTEPRTFSLRYKTQLWESTPTCAICGQRIHIIDDAEIDHVVQYWRGGKTIPSNARLSHRYCNRSRHLDREELNTTTTNINVNTLRQRRVLGRAHRGERTPNETFRIPILKVLMKLGGRGEMNEILDSVEVEMNNILKSKDFELLPSGKSIRWRNSACWERLKMKIAGLLRSDSPTGIWEITEKGKKYLEQHKD